MVSVVFSYAYIVYILLISYLFCLALQVKDIKEGPPAVTVARTTPSVPGQKHPKHVTKDIEVPVKSSAKPAQDNETTASDGIGSENNSLRNG